MICGGYDYQIREVSTAIDGRVEKRDVDVQEHVPFILTIVADGNGINRR